MNNRIAALSLSLALTVSLCTSVQAAESQTVQATQNAAITVTMDGAPQTFHNEQGGVVLPMTYNGTTYLPVRAVSALAGLSVEWDGATQTVKLTTPETRTPTTSPADGSSDGLTSQTVPALLNGSITVTLDGAAQTFHNEQGAVVLPLTYDGTTYLPVRAVCGLVEISVDWDQTTNTVILGNNSSTPQISDGATQVTEASGIAYSLSGGMVSTANGFVSDPNRTNRDYAGMNITLSGYTQLTYTVTADVEDCHIWFVADNPNDPIYGILMSEETVKAGETKTISLNIAGHKMGSIHIAKSMPGDPVYATITNMYLTK